jgi:hypothetical protein
MKNKSEEVLNSNIVINNGEDEKEINFDQKFGELKRKIY